MADQTQAQSADTLSPEDSAALVHAQQQLYSAGDPRAAKLYNYIVQAGYATKGDDGSLQPTGATKSFYDANIKGTLSGTAGWQQAIDKAAQTQPVDTSSVGAAAKSVANDLGAGVVRMAAPLVHPLNTVGGMLKAGGQLATGGSGAMYDLNGPAAAAVRPIVQNPSGEAVAAIPQAAMALAGGGREAAENVGNAIDRSGAGGGVVPNAAMAVKSAGAKLLPSLVDGPPESLLTRAVKPGKNNVGWNADVQTAIPLMKSAEQTIGRPIAGVDDALEAAQTAKKAIWQQYQQRLSPANQMGAMVDGNQIADAMVNSIDKRTAIQNPDLVQKVQQVADTYRKPIPLSDAEDFLQSANKDLNSYYAKNKVGQQVAQNDPEISSTVAEAGALRSALYSTLDDVTGPGAAQLKQAYGSLTNVEKELYGRQLVAARQNPESLSEQLSTVRGAGKIAKGVLTLDPGDVIEGAQNIAVSRALKARNSSDAMIQRAFESAQPAAPFPTPSLPQFRGLLPRGPIQVPPPADASGVVASQPPPVAATTRAQRMGLLLPERAGGKITLMAPDPGMTPGEQTAAALQALRLRRQLQLPSRSLPIQLPPSF